MKSLKDIKKRFGEDEIERDDMEWLIDKVEEQAVIIDGQQNEIDWLRSLPLSDG